MKSTPKKNQSLPKLLKKAQEVFNAYIRKRDADLPCISCGKHHEYYDAGHYVPVKNGSFLRFHEWNVHKEGKSCNGFDEFHLIGYRRNLIDKIGLPAVEWLENNRHTVKKYTRQEVEEIINKYK
jgi:Bacteriophage Lambda NinG protein